jgi:hypothetical protein
MARSDFADEADAQELEAGVLVLRLGVDPLDAVGRAALLEVEVLLQRVVAGEQRGRAAAQRGGRASWC